MMAGKRHRRAADEMPEPGQVVGAAAQIAAGKPVESAAAARLQAGWDEVPQIRRFEIRTANKDFEGERWGVKFKQGVGYTSDAAAARHCHELGYRVMEL